MPQSEQKVCQNCKTPFVIDASDFNFYKKVGVPPPTFCWLCRAQRRLAFRNDHFIYKRKSDFSNSTIFSMHSPESPVKVYETDVWVSDKWDSMEYGRDVDFSRPFLSQVFDLMHEVPHRARSMFNSINSDYSSNFNDFKNCYLCFGGSFSEDCSYSTGISNSKDCVDVSYVTRCELCYESFWLNSCNRVFFSSHCTDCVDVYFSKNLRGCSNCFGCVNLRNKSYHIFNKPYSKREYLAKLKEFNLSSFNSLEKMKPEVRRFWLRFPNKFIEGVKNTNVSGEYIAQSKDVQDSYFIVEGENMRYCQFLRPGPDKDCYDLTLFSENELVYEGAMCGDGAYGLKFCLECYSNVRNLEYCIQCSNSVADCFGCVGLKNKQYCILNRQYTKDEYINLREKIIEYMSTIPYTDKKGRIYMYGEFFPSEFSPFAYNETLAQEFFPRSQDEIVQDGQRWKEFVERDYQVSFRSAELPDRIDEASDSILDETIGCAHGGTCNEQCTTAFKLIPQELQFYKRMNLPLPRLCPNCRYYQRMKQRNPLQLWHRKCQCAGASSENGVYKNIGEHFHGREHCTNEFETSYSPERKEIVYCEQCYNSEVV